MQLKQGERLRLPEELREELSRPAGTIYSDVKEIPVRENIISVGDETTNSLIDMGIRPILSIFDLRSRRMKFSDILLYKFPWRIIVKNAPGYITYDLFKSVRYALDNGIPAIQVIGEEDLASLVCIHHASMGVTIIYGIPNMGLALVKVDKDLKERTEIILGKMVIEDGA
ncbi:MAG: GTP-dependent dephospho-CoA kinase family protein [Thermoplasmata archaeon]